MNQTMLSLFESYFGLAPAGGYKNKEQTKYVGRTAPEPEGWAISGFEKQAERLYGSGDGLKGARPSYRDVPIWTRKAAPAAPAPAPAAPAPTPPPAPAPIDQGIIDSTPGTNTSINGAALGIRSNKSVARKTAVAGMGTNRLTIPRSSGASSLNIG